MSTTPTETKGAARKAPAGKRANVASRKKSSTAATKKAATKKPAKSAPTKDPKGGLTAAGRKAFAERDGSHLKPGITKPMSEMTPEEMKRKGSWAVRFYGRAGEPAWGEPVPKTEAAARRIAAQGHKLLERYHRLRDAK